MRPAQLKTRLFVDGGDPAEVREMLRLCGFLDGQTTNPSLIAKNPDVKKRMDKGGKFTEKELLDFYRQVVREASPVIPAGSISIEVYADARTTADQMFAQAREFFTWIPNAHIKFPTTGEGLKAAERAVREGIRVNMTLVFTQEQAAAVHAATKGAKKGAVFLSPFIGRLDDRGENGMDLIANIIRTYRKAGSHVEVLTASVRTMDHFLYAIRLGSDIITSPFSILREWGAKGMPLPGADYRYDAKALKPIPYKELDLSKRWQDFDIRHDLTDKGMEKFSADWNALLKK